MNEIDNVQLLNEEFQRSIDEVSEESSRIGTLIGAQIAITAVFFVDKIFDLIISPITFLMIIILIVTITYGYLSVKIPICRRLLTSSTPPSILDDDLEFTAYITGKLIANRSAAKAREHLFLWGLGATVLVILWAFIILLPYMMLGNALNGIK